jgi:hypothetical protein
MNDIHQGIKFAAMIFQEFAERIMNDSPQF